MPFTKRITIERYKEPGEYGGLIEGETDDGRQWILYLDAEGRPRLFWPQRDPDGAVVGEPIGLSETMIERVRRIMEPTVACDAGSAPERLDITRRETSCTFDVVALVDGEEHHYEVEQEWHIRPRELAADGLPDGGTPTGG